MFSIRRLTVLGLALFTVASSFAASVVGTWNGHVDLAAYKPKNAGDMAKTKEMMNGLKVILTFKADKTFSVSFTNAKSKAPQTQHGTWVQTGNVIKAKDSSSTETLTLSPNGKTLTLVAEGMEGAKFVFVRPS
jgi:hypothetical protein